MRPASILVVEGDARSLAELTDILHQAGHDPLSAAHGEEALARFRTGLHDLVIADLGLRPMGALELLRRLRTRDPRIPVVLATEPRTVPAAVEALSQGASDYVTKPFAPQEVLTTVRRIVEIERLARENRSLEMALVSRGGFSGIVGRSAAMRTVFARIRDAADSVATVLIEGERGVGKDLVARALHFQSRRSTQPYVAVRCGNLSASQIERELFGGARSDQAGDGPGGVERADGGTLYLEDADHLPLHAQDRLLRLIQAGSVERPGSSRPRSVDVRVVLAVANDLRQAVSDGEFSQDLYYRASVLPIRLPPLRERREDILPLADHFLQRFAERDGGPALKLDIEAARRLEDHAWPGNVRELEAVMERVSLTCPGPRCGPESLPSTLLQAGQDPIEATNLRAPPPGGLSLLDELDRIESRYIRWALEQSRGNKTKAAQLLRMSRTTLAGHMNRLAITAAPFQ